MKTKFFSLLFIISSISMAQQISRGALNTASTVSSAGMGNIAIVENNVRSLIAEKHITAPLRAADDEKFVLENIFPNPATNDIVINTASAEPGKIQFRFLTLYGTIVSETAWKKIEKGNFAIALDISILPAGIYLVDGYFRNSAGALNVSDTSKLIKLH